MDHIHWLADGQPSDIKTVSEMSGIDFFLLLDKKIDQTKKDIARARKNAVKK